MLLQGRMPCYASHAVAQRSRPRASAGQPAGGSFCRVGKAVLLYHLYEFALLRMSGSETNACFRMSDGIPLSGEILPQTELSGFLLPLG